MGDVHSMLDIVFILLLLILYKTVNVHSIVGEIGQICTRSWAIFSACISAFAFS